MIRIRDKSFLVPNNFITLHYLYMNSFSVSIEKINEGKQNNCDRNSIDRITCVFPILWLVVTSQMTLV